MRSGERAAPQADAGLRKDGLSEIGQKRLVRGVPYIAKLTEMELLSASHDVILLAPSLICRETLAAIIRHSSLAATYATIREEPRIHSGERQKEWETFVASFSLAGEVQTLADLKRAEALASKTQGLASDFLQDEGTRMLELIVSEISALRSGSVMLCIMNSPVIEAIWLALWRNSSLIFREARPLDSIPVLDNLDSIAFEVQEGKITQVFEYRHEDKVRKKLEEDAALLKLR